MSHPKHYGNQDLARDGILDYLNGPEKKSSMPQNITKERPSTTTKSRMTAKSRGNDINSGGKWPRNPNSASCADKTDRIFNLEKENNVLKEKENLLSGEVLKMKTKLNRIDGLIRSRNMHAGAVEGSSYDVRDMQRDLKLEFDDLRDQNTAIKEKVRKLHVIQRGLAARPALASKPDKYAHVQGKLDMGHSKMTSHYSGLVEDLRAQLKKNHGEILRLQSDLNRQNEAMGGAGSAGGVEQIRKEIVRLNAEIRDMVNEGEQIQGEFMTNDQIFKQSKNYVKEIQAKIREESAQNEKLKQENFRLHLQTQEMTDLENELQQIQDERDHIERSIRNVTAEPFMRNQSGQSIGVRIADLELKLKEKTQIQSALRQDELKKQKEFNATRSALEKLRGEKDYLSGEHAKLKADFQEKHQSRAVNQEDVVKSMFNIDARKYSQMMTDLAMGGAEGTEPIWAKLNFLERPENTGDGKNQMQSIQGEITKLRQEKSEFAAELEKAQNLLKLQSDIEKENTVYFAQESQRLKLVEKSATLKAEEIARRADDKSKQIYDIQKKLNMDLVKTSPTKKAAAHGGLHVDDKLETMSEFSAITHESETTNDENILDFKIEDAEFYLDAFNQVPGLNQSLLQNTRAFITLVTVDFYNHNTETSQMSEGVRPNYQTQFSFKNKVDDFYVTFLQKNTVKLDVYMNKDNKAEHLGSAEVFLRELIERESASDYASNKTPVVQRWARIFPVGSRTALNSDNEPANTRPIGIIKFKMRLRKPITEAMRFYRERTEIENMTKAIATNPMGNLRANKKLVTINILGAKQLKVPYSNVTDVAPFFYYQFFTFDERYSHNGAGTNPVFDDTFSYEVMFDAKAVTYFEKEYLDVILFDDNAPIGQGTDDKGTKASDDMIGTARIPLKSLVAGASVHERIPIMAHGSNEKAGDLEVKISVMELEAQQQESAWMKTVTDLQYSKEWEKDVIMRVARKLARVNCDVELMFGIFSRGQKTCTREDFKYCCLQRLQLKKEVSEKELDLLFNGNVHFQDKNYIEKADFVQVFAGAILQAKHELQNMDAHQTSHQYENTGKISRETFAQSYKESEVIELLGEAILRGAWGKMELAAEQTAHMGEMASHQLKNVLMKEGLITDLDANKIVASQEFDGKVSFAKFQNLLQRAQANARERSASLKKLYEACRNHGKVVCQKFEAQDFNKDGLLNIDGFKASLLVREIDMSASELEESFWLICNRNQEWAYQDWIMTNFPLYRDFFISLQHVSSKEDLHTPSMTVRSDLDASTSLNADKLNSARAKIENFLRSQDLSLGTVFAVIDTDSSKQLSLSEFKVKIKALGCRLDDEEVVALFRHLDMSGDGSINYTEFVEQFSRINTQQLIRKLQNLIVGSRVDPDYYFNKYCVSDPSKGRLSRDDFGKMVKDLYNKIANFEINHVFRHFDQGNKNYVTKAEFLSAFGKEVKDGSYTVGIEDIIKPLATKVRKFGINLSNMFNKYDKNKNFRLSAEEIRDALKKDYNLVMQEQEVTMMREYFQHKYNTVEIGKQDFIDLCNTRFERKHDAAEARKSLADLRNKMEQTRANPQTLMNEYNSERTELINLRSFKLAINSTKAMGQYQIDNLAKYLDKNNEGFISIGDFVAAVNNASSAMGASFRSTMNPSATGRSVNKWAKNN